jgi:hypothetical protein
VGLLSPFHELCRAMPFLFDNVTATVIAFTVLLIVASMQMRSTQQQVAQTSQQMVQTQARELSGWLDQDLGSMGQNMSPGESAINTLQSHDGSDCSTNWTTQEFIFERKDGDGNLVKVRYKIDPSSPSSDTYRLTRKKKEEDGPNWEKDWGNDDIEVQGSATGIKYFDVDLMNENGKCTNSEGDARNIRVRFSIEAPFENEEIAFSASRGNTIVVRYRLAES